MKKESSEVSAIPPANSITPWDHSARRARRRLPTKEASTVPVASPAEFLTKRWIARRYQLSERSIDNLTAKAGMPVLRVSTRKLIYCVRDCDLFMKERFEVARRKPSTARLRVANVPAVTPGEHGGGQ